MTDPKTFQKTLSAYMVDTETTKGELARIAGISRPTFSKYWKSPESMPVGVLSRICDHLNVKGSDRAQLI